VGGVPHMPFVLLLRYLQLIENDYVNNEKTLSHLAL